MRPFTLRSAIVELRVPEAADVPAIVEACRDDATQRFTTVPSPYGRADAQFFLDRIVDHGWATGRELTWGLRAPGSSELVGMVSIRTAARDVGFWTAPAARGRGLMTEAVRLVADWALGEGGLADIRWEAYVGNDASAAVARRAGFTFTGVAPGRNPGRDGSLPLCWHGRLSAGDDRSPVSGWPAPGAAREFPRVGGVEARVETRAEPADDRPAPGSAARASSPAAAPAAAAPTAPENP